MSGTALARIAMKPKAYEPFSRLVQRAYNARPAFDSNVVQSWKDAAVFVERMFKQITSKVQVEWVSEDTYKNFDEMNESVENTGVLKIWTGASEHPVWTPEQNWMFRAVHDYQAHIAGGHQFGLAGEFAAYNRHLKMFPKSTHTCLFTEIIGQVCVETNEGKFPEQKVVALLGFDYENLGIVNAEKFKENFTQAV